MKQRKLFRVWINPVPTWKVFMVELCPYGFELVIGRIIIRIFESMEAKK